MFPIRAFARVVATLLLLGVAGTAFAQDTCPPGSISAPLTAGHRVKIVAISADDAYHDKAAQIIGTTGVVSGGTLTSNGACWMGGGFEADDGTGYYFYKAAMLDLTPTPPPEPVVSDPSCPPGAATAAGFPSGQRVKIVGVHADDAYHDKAAALIGTSGVVSGDLHNQGGCWYGGGVKADDGTEYYFYKAAVVALGAPPAEATTGSATCPAGATTTALPGGYLVKVLAVHPEDAYHATADQYVGTAGLVDGGLHSNDGCWMGGGLVTEKGDYLYFYKGAFQLLHQPDYPTLQGSTVVNGTVFLVNDLSPSDANFGSKAEIVGHFCVSLGALQSTGAGWFGGKVACLDGNTYTFHQVAVSPLK